MPKTYTVKDNSIGHIGAVQHKIDTISITTEYEGPALSLNGGLLAAGVFVEKAGNHSKIAFSAEKAAIYTRGLSCCSAVCIAYNKEGEAFNDGYLAHISGYRHSLLGRGLPSLPNPASTEMWVVVSVGEKAESEAAAIAARLVKEFHFADDHIWIYRRIGGDSTFGIDRFGNFGEV